MNRRAFITHGAGLGAALMLPRSAGGRSESGGTRPRSGPPNILFIWTDQQTATAMSNAGNPWLKTPAMDALAAKGVTFERAYCSDPICVPSRSSWITGKMPHEIGVTFNVSDSSLVAPALSRAVREHGYDTGYVGKWHIPHETKDTAWHGFDYVRHARGNRLDPDVLPAVNEFLRQERTQPFFLVASFVNPHDICEWARIASGATSGMPNGALPPAPPPEECPPLPANFAIPDGEPEVIRQLKALAPEIYPTKGWTEATWRQYLWAFYRLTERVDAQIGAIMQTIREIGADENTVVVFTSDHGDGCAAHEWNQKMVFYEEVARVPLIVRPPACARAGARDATSLVNMNLDFFPTVYDYLGLSLPDGLEGRSLRPLVEGRPGAKAHEYVISQTDLAPTYGKTGGVLGRMLRTPSHKYLRYSAGTRREQFFDLTRDPGEMVDLSLDAAHTTTLEQHRALLDEWMTRRGDPFLKLADRVAT